MNRDNDLFFVCSLIEYIGRERKQKRGAVAAFLGLQTIQHIYNYADVLHCELMERVADEFIISCSIPMGEYDNVRECQYNIPDYWDIGEVYERLIVDVCGDNMIQTVMEVYSSWIDDAISNYNSDFYYQSRDYIRECYLTGKVL